MRWRKATHPGAVGVVLEMEAGCLCFPCTLNEKRVETLCPLAVQHWSVYQGLAEVTPHSASRADSRVVSGILLGWELCS